MRKSTAQPATHITDIRRFPAIICFILCILSVCQASQSDLKASISKPGAYWKSPSTGTSRENKLTILYSAKRNFVFTISRPSCTSHCIAAVRHVPSNSIVWTSSFSDNAGISRAVAESCSLNFGKDGNLVLKEGDEKLLESRTAGMHVKVLELLENGNLILRNEMNEIVWESSKRPEVHFRMVTPQSKAEQILKQSIENGYARRFLRDADLEDPAEDQRTESSSANRHSHRKRNLALEIVLPVAAFVIICIVVIILSRKMCFKSRKTKAQVQSIRRIDHDETMLKGLSPELPPRFTYAEMYQATNGFTKKLGAGAYGAVFEGELAKEGSRIAVKVFQDIENPGCRVGFCAEVMAIGSMTHRNLVPLRGFCVEDDHRMLVYELMVNGSLDKLLFERQWDSSTDLKADAKAGGGEVPAAEVEQKQLLGWEQRRTIAIDSARALLFLHEGGERKVVHCDVKPENILLDEDWRARISDFGLSKLVGGCSAGDGPPPLEKSGGIRGTLGYVAPEWRKEGGAANVTGAADVYSFGVVLLELIAGRRSAHTGKSYLPGAAFDLLAAGGDLAELLDERLQLDSSPSPASAADLSAVRVFIRVALWCIQADPQLRPSMARVLAMLTGSEEVSPPPVCHYYAGSSHFFDDHRRPSTTTSNFDDDTSAANVYSNSWQISVLSGR